MERFRPERTAGRVQGGKAAIRGGSNQVFTAGTKLWYPSEEMQVHVHTGTHTRTHSSTLKSSQEKDHKLAYINVFISMDSKSIISGVKSEDNGES